jgi:predicted DNA-binding transcriptional regulator YafY
MSKKQATATTPAQPARGRAAKGKTSAKAKAAANPAKAVSVERAARLFKFLQYLEAEPRTRAAVLQRLRVDIRTFYRDLELLRECNVTVTLQNRKYALTAAAADASARLPFPDPNLTLGEAQQLAKGRGAIHKKLKALLTQIMQ